MEEEKLERSIRKSEIPGLTREEEEAQLAKVIGISEQNLEQAKADIRLANEDLADLMETYDAKEAEGLALWNNATAKLNAYQHGMARLEKARKKPYFGRIDFQDPRLSFLESYYIGRVGISDEKAEPVVLDWRAPISSVYYENSTGPCSYTVSSEGTFSIDLKRKRTYEIENDHLKDFFDSDVVANDELLTKYLAKNKKAVQGEIIAKIHQKLTGGKESLQIIYEPSTGDLPFEQALKRYRDRDLRMKSTTVGPHRDDIGFLTGDMDIRRYGSQGQQRTAALSLKLSEIELVRLATHDTPILLLDDVLSELDKHRQNYLLDSIHDIQTLITCTGVEDFVNHRFSINKVFHVQNGQVTKEN